MESSRAVRSRRRVRSDASSDDEGNETAAALFHALVLFLVSEAPDSILVLVVQLLPFCAAARLACVHARLNDAWKHVRSQSSRWKMVSQLRTSGEVVLCFEEVKHFRFKNDDHIAIVPQWLRSKCAASESINEFVRCVVRQECLTVQKLAWEKLETKKLSKFVLSRIRTWHIQLTAAFGNLDSPLSPLSEKDKWDIWCAAFASPMCSVQIIQNVRTTFSIWKRDIPTAAWKFVLASCMSPSSRLLELLMTEWYPEVLSQPEKLKELIQMASKSPTPVGLICVLNIAKRLPISNFDDAAKLDVCRICFINNPVNFLYIFKVFQNPSDGLAVQVVSQLFQEAKYYCSSEDMYRYKYKLFMRTFDILLTNTYPWMFSRIVNIYFLPETGLSYAEQCRWAVGRLHLSCVIGHVGLVRHIMETCATQPWWSSQHKRTFVSLVVDKSSWRDRKEVVQYILSSHARDVTREAWQASVRNAALRGHPEPLRLLLEFGVRKKWTPDASYGVPLVDDVRKTHFTHRDECVALLE